MSRCIAGHFFCYQQLVVFIDNKNYISVYGKNRMQFSPMYGLDYIVLVPMGMFTWFGWLCFIKGWAFTLPGIVMMIAIVFGIIFPAWMLFIITTNICIDPHGITRKTWFSKKSLLWDEVQTVMLFTQKGTETVIITDQKIKKPSNVFDKSDRYFTFTNRPDVEEFIVLMMKDRLPIVKQKKGFSITDLKDIADLFR